MRTRWSSQFGCLVYNESTCCSSKGAVVAEERIQIPLVLENVLRYCLKDARERMEKGEAIIPFSALAVGETLFMEEHDAEDVQACFDSAKRTVENARGAAAYGFCYDGFVELGVAGKKTDCLIAEGGCPGEPYGHAIGLTYKVKHDGSVTFADEPIYVGNSMNYMLSLTEILDENEEEASGEAASGEEGSSEEASD